MCLETVLNLKLHSSLSLRECITYICVLPWFFEGFYVQLARLFFANFLNCKMAFACYLNLSFLRFPPQSKLKEMVQSVNHKKLSLSWSPAPF